MTRQSNPPLDPTAMLKIRVTRDHLTSTATLGRVDIWSDEDEKWLPFGFSLEDADRRLLEEGGEEKRRGDTAIPLGTYDLELYDSPKHGPDTVQLVSVPLFGHVQIHPGNSTVDTKGCLLMGLSRNLASSRISSSKAACSWLREQVIRAIRAGSGATIQVARKAGATS